MRLRIVSPGQGVQVEDLETGELLEGVAHVHWSCDEGGSPRCVIAVHAAEIDAIVDDEGRRS